MSETSSHFNVYDIVAVAKTPKAVEFGLAGERMVVYQVRRYPDGTFRYSLGSVNPDPDVELGGIYWHEDLEPTGEIATGVGGIVDTYPKSYTSKKVTEEGEVTGTEGYVVLEDWMSGGIPGPDAAVLNVYADTWLSYENYTVIVDDTAYGPFDRGGPSLAIPAGEHAVRVVADGPTGSASSPTLKIALQPNGSMMIGCGPVVEPVTQADVPADSDIILEVEFDSTAP